MGVVHVSVWDTAEVGLGTGLAPDEVQIDEMMVGGHGRRTKSSTKCGGQLMIVVLHQTLQVSVNPSLLGNICGVDSKRCCSGYEQ